jgi:hypothetical protein
MDHGHQHALPRRTDISVLKPVRFARQNPSLDNTGILVFGTCWPCDRLNVPFGVKLFCGTAELFWWIRIEFRPRDPFLEGRPEWVYDMPVDRSADIVQEYYDLLRTGYAVPVLPEPPPPGAVLIPSQIYRPSR